MKYDGTLALAKIDRDIARVEARIAEHKVGSKQRQRTRIAGSIRKFEDGRLADEVALGSKAYADLLAERDKLLIVMAEQAAKKAMKKKKKTKNKATQAAAI